ncbi:CCA tRNA nucleotidyltransferase [Thermoactinomyces daqus]|uniref:CCA tRNA nucleotidyltransferase n=1 Tax=Thermoactinomyces daqus TaxID=1329516 RepID=A0A7W1XAS3_9BACL|nr:CCA tRNA nucleotidyltransferase [Thermoactinomyces daqus]MBA4543170.1 CCA tRNA nucleotidyltransferase [Thermoactinomyces daqus]
MDTRKAAALSVMEQLEKSGFQAYLVGGCVRDEMLGISPQDYDIATDAVPDQVQNLFPRTIPTGLKHGTVTVVEQGIPLEVTTFRIEEAYLDRRRPSQVRFVSSLKQDLARRDFTINAMAKNRRGQVIDYFSGKEDLLVGRIRTVGNPRDRFREDALRMLRAVRFVAQFGFALEEETRRALIALRSECFHLSVERVVQELEKMWKAVSPSAGVRELFSTDLLRALPPFCRWDLQSFPPDQAASFDHTSDRIVRWAYLLWLCQTDEACLGRRLKALKLPTRDQKQISVCFRLMLAGEWTATDPVYWKRQLLRHGLDSVRRSGQLRRLVGKIMDKDLTETRFQDWWNEMPVKERRELALGGEELIRYSGKKAGPWVGQVLNNLYEQVALGLLPNDKNALLEEGYKIGKVDSQ